MLKPCRHFLNSSLGLVEIVEERKTRSEAIKYCEENDGMLIPLHNQNIADEVADRLVNCLGDYKETITRKYQLWHIGINLKNDNCEWIDGEEFDGSKYRPEIKLAVSRCKDLSLYSRGSLYYSSPLMVYPCKISECKQKFLCLKNKNLESTTKSFNNNTTSLDIPIVIGLSVGLFLSILFICWLIFKIFVYF